MKIVGFMGRMGAGKTTTADAVASYLLKEYGLHALRTAFAAPLKKTAWECFGVAKNGAVNPNVSGRSFPRMCEMLAKEYAPSDDKKRKELEDAAFEILGGPHHVYHSAGTKSTERKGAARHFLQFLGTEVVRGVLRDDYWVQRLLETARDAESLVNYLIVDDCRFPNEAEALKDAGATLIYMDVPAAVRAEWLGVLEEDLDKMSRHASETHDLKVYADIIVGAEDLKSSVKRITKLIL